MLVNNDNEYTKVRPHNYGNKGEQTKRRLMKPREIKRRNVSNPDPEEV